MDILTSLNEKSSYSSIQLQLILSAWVMSGIFAKSKVAADSGDVNEDDYSKQSLYSLLYSMYRTVGNVNDAAGKPYEFTFNTWGYAWPKGWGKAPFDEREPQRFGKNAYTGLFHFDAAKKYIKERKGRVHVVEMGCGTGAGASEICHNVLPEATYAAYDMQAAAIATCNRKFVPSLNGRLVATAGDCTKMSLQPESADFVVINETHVTEHAGVVTEHDEEFFKVMHNVLRKGGYLVWGNAIPDSTWKPCFKYLKSIGMKLIQSDDVTKEAIIARDDDESRTTTYVERCLNKFWGFHIPVVGAKRRGEAGIALKNFFRHPGTNLYNNMVDGTDTYKVVLLQKIK
jgi:precorrin-6B methylase 2